MDNETVKHNDSYDICLVVSFFFDLCLLKHSIHICPINHTEIAQKKFEEICDHVQSDTVTGCCNIIALAKKPYAILASSAITR